MCVHTCAISGCWVGKSTSDRWPRHSHTPHGTDLVRQDIAVAARDGEDMGGAQNHLEEDDADGPGVVRLGVAGLVGEVSGAEEDLWEGEVVMRVWGGARSHTPLHMHTCTHSHNYTRNYTSGGMYSLVSSACEGPPSP